MVGFAGESGEGEGEVEVVGGGQGRRHDSHGAAVNGDVLAGRRRKKEGMKEREKEGVVCVCVYRNMYISHD